MLKTLILKEIQESILNMRFLFIFLICIVVIPISFYLGADEYKTRKEHIDNLEKLYIQKNEGNVRYDIMAEGYRRPSPLSIFCIGLENFLPDKTITNRDKSMQFSREWGLNNPLSLLTGKMDFVYVVGFIMSLLVLSLTFNSISGEKENGTMRLILSNNVPKWKVVIAKITGPFTLFAISFITGVLLGIIILLLTKSGIEVNAYFFKMVFLITILSLLFLFTIFNVGIFLSIVSKNTYLSMVSSLLLYIFFALLVPKLSPMLAQVIYPVKSIQVYNTEKNMLLEQKTTEREDCKKELMTKLKTSYGLPLSLSELDTPEKKALYDKVIVPMYDEQITTIDEKFSKEMESEVSKIENAYQQKINTQKGIALNISRISPFSSYINIISDISSTGFSEVENFNVQAQKFQYNVKADIYDKVITKKYYDSGGYRSRSSSINGFDIRKAVVPRISDYKYLTPSYAIYKNWPDLLLICSFTILFFMACVVGFLRFDVR
jgi:ABC-type transport system involved in multi-copper enzyme maturation permease subunit